MPTFRVEMMGLSSEEKGGNCQGEDLGWNSFSVGKFNSAAASSFLSAGRMPCALVLAVFPVMETKYKVYLSETFLTQTPSSLAL